MSVKMGFTMSSKFETASLSSRSSLLNPMLCQEPSFFTSGTTKESMVEDVIGSFVSCAICSSPFSADHPAVYCVPCGNVFCGACIAKLFSFSASLQITVDSIIIVCEQSGSGGGGGGGATSSICAGGGNASQAIPGTRPCPICRAPCTSTWRRLLAIERLSDRIQCLERKISSLGFSVPVKTDPENHSPQPTSPSSGAALQNTNFNQLLHETIMDTKICKLGQKQKSVQALLRRIEAARRELTQFKEIKRVSFSLDRETCQFVSQSSSPSSSLPALRKSVISSAKRCLFPHSTSAGERGDTADTIRSPRTGTAVEISPCAYWSHATTVTPPSSQEAIPATTAADEWMGEEEEEFSVLFHNNSITTSPQRYVLPPQAPASTPEMMTEKRTNSSRCQKGRRKRSAPPKSFFCGITDGDDDGEHDNEEENVEHDYTKDQFSRENPLESPTKKQCKSPRSPHSMPHQTFSPPCSRSSSSSRSSSYSLSSQSSMNTEDDVREQKRCVSSFFPMQCDVDLEIRLLDDQAMVPNTVGATTTTTTIKRVHGFVFVNKKKSIHSPRSIDNDAVSSHRTTSSLHSATSSTFLDQQCNNCTNIHNGASNSRSTSSSSSGSSSEDDEEINSRYEISPSSYSSVTMDETLGDGREFDFILSPGATHRISLHNLFSTHFQTTSLSYPKLSHTASFGNNESTEPQKQSIKTQGAEDVVIHIYYWIISDCF
jgi:hypothetical protein